jgi:hypothetical protein
MPDFQEYCGGILKINDDLMSFPTKRSRVAALLPAWFAQGVGVLDGLAWAGVVCSGMLAAALYLWGRVLAGRAAGILCVAVALASAPLSGLPRFLAYYPELAAGLTCAAAATSAALMRPSPWRMAAAGAGVGLCLVLDVRGLVWAVPYGVVVCLASLHASGSWRRRVLLLLCALAPVWLAWFVGWYAYTAMSLPLEAQMDIRPLFHAHGVNAAGFLPPYSYSTGFIWGWTSPMELLSTARFMVWQQALQGTVTSPFSQPSAVIVEHHRVWQAALLAGAPVAALALLRRPRALVALVASVLPFLIAFRSIGTSAELSARFYIHALPGIAVVLGVAGGAVMAAAPRLPWRGPPPWLRGLLIAVAALLFVFGPVPSWLALDAPWREPLPCHDGARKALVRSHGDRSMMGFCANAVLGDEPDAVMPVTVLEKTPWEVLSTVTEELERESEPTEVTPAPSAP